MFIIYPAKFLSAPGIASQEALKKTEVKLELLTDFDILLMVEKGIKEDYVMQFIDMPNNHHILNIGI